MPTLLYAFLSFTSQSSRFIMESRFYLARELKHGRFPGDGKAAAVVRSRANPRIHASFLCYPDPEIEHRKHIEGEDAVRKSLKLKYRAYAQGRGLPPHLRPPPRKPKLRVEKHADLDAELTRRPLAHIAASHFAGDDAPPRTLSLGGGAAAGKKRRRAAADESDSDEDEATAAGKPHGAPHAGAGHESEPDSDSSDDEPGVASKASSILKLQGDAVFSVVPYTDPKWRSAAYLAGKAGSGKSTKAGEFIKNYKAIFPHRPIYGVGKAKLKDDPALAGLGIRQLKVSFFRETRASASAEGGGAGGVAGSGAAGPTVFDIKAAFGDEGCLVLFDDWDSFQGDDKKVIKGAITDILNMGRKPNVSIVVTSHLLNNYAETRGIISEADFITVFPPCCQHHHLEYFLTNCGVPKEMVASLKERGPWITLHNTQPTYVISQQMAQML